MLGLASLLYLSPNCSCRLSQSPTLTPQACTVIQNLQPTDVQNTYDCTEDDECINCAGGICDNNILDTLWKCVGESSCKATKDEGPGGKGIRNNADDGSGPHFYFDCSGDDSCQDMGTFSPPPGDLTACCSAKAACKAGNMAAKNTLNLECGAEDACQDRRFSSLNTIIAYCAGTAACKAATFDAPTVQLTCLSGSAVCDDINFGSGSTSCCCDGGSNCPGSCTNPCS